MELHQNRQYTELELLRMRMNKTTDESVESTRRMVRMTDESHRTGTEAMHKLLAQGEQLRRVNSEMNAIHEDVRQADKHLNELDKCCFLCVCPWNRPKHKFRDAKVFKQDIHPTAKLNKPQSTEIGRSLMPNSAPPGPIITRILNDDRETEMEDNLQQVFSVVGELKHMSVEMNQEIRSQNSVLNQIQKKADVNRSNLSATQNRAERYLGKPTAPEKSIIPKPTGLGALSMVLK